MPFLTTKQIYMQFTFETMPDITTGQAVLTAFLTLWGIVGVLWIMIHKFNRSLKN